MTNRERLEKSIDKIQHQRAVFLSRVEGLSQRQLDFKPSRSSWSIGEVVHHVALTEQFLLRNAQDILQSAGEAGRATRKVSLDQLPLGPQLVPHSILRLPFVLAPITLMSSLAPQFLQSFVLANPLIKARTAPYLEPKAAIPRRELLGFLDQVRRSTLAILEAVKDRDLSHFRWKHPLMGSRSIYGVVDLLPSHDQRHESQIDRIRRHPRFPKS